MWDKANRKVYESLRASAGDNKGRKLSVQLVNDGVIEDLSGASLSLFWETKDKAYKGLDAFTAVDATKGEFEICYTTGMLSNEGTLNANLVLVDTSGRVVSEPFTITVFKGIDDDAIQSSDSFTALTEALAQVGTINNKADRDELLALESTFEQNNVSINQQLQQTEQNLTAQLQQTTETLAGIDRTFGDITFATFSELQSAFPTGDMKRYIVAADGKWYWWNGTTWTAGQVAQAIGIADKTVSAEKLDFMRISTNLFDKRTIISDKVISATTGELIDSASKNCTSDFIPVEPNTIYTRYCLSPITRIGYYTKDKVFISQGSNNASTATPNNTYFVRLSFIEARADTTQFNKGSVLLPYEPYYKLLPEDMFPLESVSDGIKTEVSSGLAEQVETMKNELKAELTTGVRNRPYYFMPENITGFYKATTGTYNSFNTVQELNTAFTTLASEHSDYITQTLLGNDQSGTYPIYEFHLKPIGITSSKLTKTLPKIVIVCGQHGREKGSVFSLYHLTKELCENWTTNPLLEYLRWNVELVFIPLANPWAFQNGDGRRNSRDVDINRNYSYDWTQGTIGDVTYGGSEPFSEVETQYVKQVIDRNLDAIYFGDYHTNGSSGASYNTLMWHSQIQGELENESVQIASKYLIEKATREFIKSYNLPDDEGFFGYVSHPVNHSGMAKAYAASKGIPSNTFESFRKFPTETDFYSSDTVKATTEYVGNWLLTLIKQFREVY